MSESLMRSVFSTEFFVFINQKRYNFKAFWFLKNSFWSISTINKSSRRFTVCGLAKHLVELLSKRIYQQIERLTPFTAFFVIPARSAWGHSIKLNCTFIGSEHRSQIAEVVSNLLLLSYTFLQHLSQFPLRLSSTMLFRGILLIFVLKLLRSSDWLRFAINRKMFLWSSSIVLR